MFLTANDGCRLNLVPGASAQVPIVFSNSLGTDHTLWDSQMPALNGDAAWRYDTRGHGQSDIAPGEYSIERLGQDLLHVIDATGAHDADICGLSIGGITALWVAIHHPARVRRLILGNTAARIGDRELWDTRIRTVRAGGLGAIAEGTMQRWFTDAYRSAHAGIVDGIRATFEQTSADGYVACCAVLRDADLRGQAAHVKCPTLVIAGVHDPATPPEAGVWLAGQIPGAQVVTLDAAHLSNVEQPHEFNAAIRAYLS